DHRRRTCEASARGRPIRGGWRDAQALPLRSFQHAYSGPSPAARLETSPRLPRLAAGWYVGCRGAEMLHRRVANAYGRQTYSGIFLPGHLVRASPAGRQARGRVRWLLKTAEFYGNSVVERFGGRSPEDGGIHPKFFEGVVKRLAGPPPRIQ